jgi:sulfate permease, SulP family
MPGSDDGSAVSVNPINRFLSIVIAGVICGLLAVVLSIGHGSLVFATHQTSYLPFTVGLSLLSTCILATVAALASSIRSSVAIVQEVPCVALGVIVGATLQQLSPTASETQTFVTVMAALGVGTLLTGLGVFLLGVFRLGGIVRFIPYPVIGGFLAGTGWLIVLGGLGLVLAEPATLALFAALPEAGAVVRLGLAVLFAIVLAAAGRKFSSPLTLPLVVVASIVLFNVVSMAVGTSASELRTAGWLVALPRSAAILDAGIFSDLGETDWWAVAIAMVNLPVIIVITAIALLLNATGIELAQRSDVDLNSELRIVGAGNGLVGVVGGLPGYHAISLTLAALRLGANSRWVGIIAAGTVFAALLFKTGVLDIIPTLVLGGLLIWLGGSLIVDWLVKPFRQIDAAEYAVIALIFVTVVAFGFTTGIVAGMFAAVLIFVYQSSQVDTVRHQLTGSEYQSRVDGAPWRDELLREHGSAILIVKLQGFLFFGTANRLRRRLQEYMTETTSNNVGFLLLDFRRATGLDSSAISSFIRLEQIATQYGVTIIFTGLSETAHRALMRSDLDLGHGSSIRVEPNLESGLKWSEDMLISRLDRDGAPERSRTLAAVLLEVVNDTAAAEVIGEYCKREVVEPGTRLIEQGSWSNEMFFIESGDAVVEVSEDGATSVQIATVGPGGIVGEIAFYLDDKRTGSVVAKNLMVVWRLSGAAIKRLNAEAPDAALLFHQGMAAMLSKRLSRTNRLVSFLSD